MRRRKLPPAHRSASVGLNFEAANVIDDCLAPAVNMRPGAIAHAILRTGYVDYITATTRRWYTIVRLLIGNHDDAVIRIAYLAEGVAQLCSTVRLAGYNRITQSEAATRWYPNQVV